MKFLYDNDRNLLVYPFFKKLPVESPRWSLNQDNIFVEDPNIGNYYALTLET
jgi:hypothetical protein